MKGCVVYFQCLDHPGLSGSPLTRRMSQDLKARSGGPSFVFYCVQIVPVLFGINPFYSVLGHILMRQRPNNTLIFNDNVFHSALW